MRDYWLSKLCYDVQAAGAEYRADREKFLARYQLKPDVIEALRRNDVAYLAKRVNPYLLRFYFGASGMKDEEFIRRLRESASDQVKAAEPPKPASRAKASHG